MSGDYKSYSKAQFERILTIYRVEYKLGFWKDITTELESETNSSHWEFVYALTTNSPKVRILVYSSVDRRTGWTRDRGQDRVRLVYRAETKKGLAYAKIKRHNRVENLFETLKGTLEETFNVKEYTTANKNNLNWLSRVD